MGIDTAWAVEQMTIFLEAVEGETPHGEIAAQAHVVEQILDRVIRNWRSKITKDGTGGMFPWAQHEEAAHRAIAQLRRDAEIREKLGDDAPVLDAATLHPWVWDGARSLWQSGHYREAVIAASRKINAEAQNKVGRRDISEVDLFKQAFSDDPPKPGAPRLRVVPDDGSRTSRDVHRGVRAFAEGCYAALRNPGSHQLLDELPENEALEQLAAFSLLARWVDTAILVN